MSSISPEHAQFLDGPNTVIVATRDERLFPDVTRGIAVRCDPSRARLTLWLPAFTHPEVLEQLRSNGAIALSASQLLTHRALQVKGRATAVREDLSEAERAAVEQSCAAYIGELEQLGLPRRVVERACWLPAIAVDVEVSDVFEQTPGPGAGARYAGPCP